MSPSPPDPLDHAHLTLVGLLVEAAAGLDRVVGRRLEAEGGLPVPWFEILLRLARTPGERLRMSDLAAQTTLTTSGLTRAVDRLEQEGFVRREACTEDRRGAYAALTDRGRDRIRTAVTVHLEHLAVALSALTDVEQAQLTELLRRLRDAFNPDAARASEPRPSPRPS